MGRKSSKTAHVLNLLTAGASDEAQAEGDQPEEELSVAKMVQKQPARTKKAPAVKESPELPAATPVLKPEKQPAVAVIAAKPAITPDEFSNEPTPEPQPLPVLPAAAAIPAAPLAAPSPEPATIQADAPLPVPEPPVIPNTPADNLHSLINIAEYAIAERMDEIMERMNACRCSLCKKDIITAALNLVPVQYVLDEDLQGNALEQYLADNNKAVTAALVKACIKVKTNPRH